MALILWKWYGVFKEWCLIGELEQIILEICLLPLILLVPFLFIWLCDTKKSDKIQSEDKLKQSNSKVKEDISYHDRWRGMYWCCEYIQCL